MKEIEADAKKKHQESINEESVDLNKKLAKPEDEADISGEIHVKIDNELERKGINIKLKPNEKIKLKLGENNFIESVSEVSKRDELEEGKRTKSAKPMVKLSHKHIQNIEMKCNPIKIHNQSISSPKVIIGAQKFVKVIKKSILVNLKDQKSQKSNKDQSSLKFDIKSPSGSRSKVHIRPQSRNSDNNIHKSQADLISSNSQSEQSKDESKKAVRGPTTKYNKKDKGGKLFVSSISYIQSSKEETKGILKHRSGENWCKVKKYDKTGLNKTLMQPKIVISHKKDKGGNMNSSTIISRVKKEEPPLAPPKGLFKFHK